MTDHASCSTVLSAPKIAIIGGGLTGLLTATLLERASNQTGSSSNNPQITIFEKSRSVGRLATRYRSDSKTDKKQRAMGRGACTLYQHTKNDQLGP